MQVKGSGTVDIGDGNNTRTTAVITDWHLQGGKLLVRADTEVGDTANDFYFEGGALSTGNAEFTLTADRVLNFNHASGGTVDTAGSDLTLGTAGQLAGCQPTDQNG